VSGRESVVMMEEDDDDGSSGRRQQQQHGGNMLRGRGEEGAGHVPSSNFGDGAPRIGTSYQVLEKDLPITHRWVPIVVVVVGKSSSSI